LQSLFRKLSVVHSKQQRGNQRKREQEVEKGGEKGRERKERTGEEK
jgi:hypothetical protein